MLYEVITQPHAAVLFPVPGQKVIVENIQDNRRIVPVSRPEPLFAFGNLGVSVCEGVNFTVEKDSQQNFFLIGIFSLSLYRITSYNVCYTKLLRERYG